MPEPRESLGKHQARTARPAVGLGDFTVRESMVPISFVENVPLVGPAADRVCLVCQCTGGGPATISTTSGFAGGLGGLLLSLGDPPLFLIARDHTGLVQSEWWLLGGGAGNVSVIEVFYRKR